MMSVFKGEMSNKKFFQKQEHDYDIIWGGKGGWSVYVSVDLH